MTKHGRRMLIALAVIFGSLQASPASATTVSPAGTVGATSAQIGWTVNGVTLTCSSSALSLSLGTSGTGSVTGAAYNTCRQASLGTWTVTPSLPWGVTISSTSSGVDTAFSSMSFQIAGSIGCRYTVSGSQTATSSGTLPLTLGSWAWDRAGSSFVVSGSTGCLGLVNNGDAFVWQGRYTLGTAQIVS